MKNYSLIVSHSLHHPHQKIKDPTTNKFTEHATLFPHTSRLLQLFFTAQRGSLSFFLAFLRSGIPLLSCIVQSRRDVAA